MLIFNKDLENLFIKEITGLGFAFVGLEITTQGKGKLLRVYVDTEDSTIDSGSKGLKNNKVGVTLEDCSRINRYLRKVISIMPEFNLHNFGLEVSSPGLERKLFKLHDFVKQLGKEIKVSLRVPLEGKFKFIGVLLEVDCKLHKIIMEIDKQNISLDYDEIAKANLVYR